MPRQNVQPALRDALTLWRPLRMDDVADATGVPYGTLSNIRYGRTRATAEFRLKLAAYLETYAEHVRRVATALAATATE